MYVPAGSQIAIASREEPPLALARWRAQGSVREIGVADLRLDEQEAGSAARRQPASSSTPRALRVDRADGGLACRPVPRGPVVAGRGRQVAGPLRALTGDDRFVSDYFRLELLSRLPAAEAQFLKYTSVLERMSRGLCDAVLETTRSAHTLETLERTNCFVVPLDRRTGWYRYHHLFGELLRDELERTEPEVVPALNASCDGLVHRQRLRRRRLSSTGMLRARRAPSPV